VLYAIGCFVLSLTANFVLGVSYNKGSLAAGIALAASVIGLGVLGGVLRFGSHRGTPFGSAGAGLLAGSITTAVLCAATLVWIILYMRGDI